MRELRWLCVLLLAGAPAVSFAGDIQVTCGAGLRIFLDGKLLGTSTAKDDGLYVANVPQGAHVVRVEKDGFEPQTFNVEIRELPIEVRVAPFTPKAPAASPTAAPPRQGQPNVGSVQVLSAPQNCTVAIDGKPEVKDSPVLLLEGLAGGEHAITFSKDGYQTISGVVGIIPGAEVGIRGDLQTGKIEDVYDGVGSLRVFSTPEFCKVQILGMIRDKTGLVLNLSYLPAGAHPIVITWKRFELSTTVKILKGQRTILTVSLLKKAEPFAVSYEPE